MKIITSHTGADFDTVASMVAAKKLYPDAIAVFSGALEKRVSEVVGTLGLPYRFSFANEMEINAVDVDLLILVDVKQPGRIGSLSALLNRPVMEVHVYDHHPVSAGDIRGSVEHIRPYGSTTTVLTLLIKEKGMALTRREATIMMAGIYEDTGSLSFPSTTIEDFEAAAFLLSCGADLAEVSGFIKREMTSVEVSLLDGFLQSETLHSIGGISVTIADGYMERYAGDISILAHKMMEIDGLKNLFLVADAIDRVHIVARSRDPEVNAGAILGALGGGGHTFAASATLKDMTLIQAKDALLDALRRNIVPKAVASDICSSPAITVSPQTPVRDAVTIMLKYNINAAPVADSSGCLGVITRQIADKSVFHGLGAHPVSAYMTTECETVGWRASIDEIRERIASRGARLLPVIKDGLVAGVITRTDLLKLLEEELNKADGGKGARPRNMRGIMRERLPEWVIDILEDAGRAADELGMSAYVVGGFTRDLLLRRPNLDVDIVIEGGNGIAFAEAFASRRGAEVKTHERFKTAILVFPDGFKVDVATARLEYYERPGALPTVQASSLKLDLYRRDFVINTLAIALNPQRFGQTIDFFGAQKDIKEKTIRVLHNLSFVEDPTRLLRAIRFSEKFGFKVSKHTLYLVKNSVRQDIFKKLKGARLFDELKNILEEDAAVGAISKLHELGILALVHKDISWGVERAAFFEKAKEALAWHELLYTKDKAEGWLTLFLALTDTVKDKELAGLVERLCIPGRKTLEAIEARRAASKALNMINSGAITSLSGAYELLAPLPLETTLYMLAKAHNEKAKKDISTHISTLKHLRTHLNGEDLKRLGFKEGAEIGDALDAIFKKRCDNELESREDEDAFARELLRRTTEKTA
ncbi:MAG: CBS domain-containing protein [Deltaproteobacteria bacterium]|nr:CBS domain-containing protein [Deltaproteobacteria bacterium]